MKKAACGVNAGGLICRCPYQLVLFNTVWRWSFMDGSHFGSGNVFNLTGCEEFEFLAPGKP